MKSRATTTVLSARNDRTSIDRISLMYCAVILWFIMAVAVFTASAQQTDKTAAHPVQQATTTPVSSKDIGPTGSSIRPYSPAGRDPFRRFVPPKAGPKTTKGDVKSKQMGYPTLELRRIEFQQKVAQLRSRDLAEPNPVIQYLVSELDVTGVFRDNRGFGAFLRAQPTGTTFFVRSGDRCYNGEVLRIENDDSDSDGSKVLFREESRTEVNGKPGKQERVVAKTPVRAGSS